MILTGTPVTHPHLNTELQPYRSSAEKSLAEVRALLARREAAHDQERASTAALEQALAQARLKLEFALDRIRLTPQRGTKSIRIQAERVPPQSIGNQRKRKLVRPVESAKTWRSGATKAQAASATT